MRVALPRFRCPYCSHIWIPRKDVVTKCPNCKNSLRRFSLEELLLPVKAPE